MIVFVFYLSHCWGECATVGEVGQTVNLLPSGWVGSNPTTPTTISAKVKCFGKEYARLWRWAYLVCRCSTMVQCSSLPSWRWGFDSLHLLKFAGIAQRLVHRLAMPRMWVRFSLSALVHLYYFEVRVSTFDCVTSSKTGECKLSSRILWPTFYLQNKVAEPRNRWIRECMLYCV